jgi:hypothetical protein
MANLEAPRSGTDIAAGTYVLGPAAQRHSVAVAVGAVNSAPLGANAVAAILALA